MRTTLLVLALATLVSACSWGSDAAGSADSVDSVETATTQQAGEAVPAAAQALSATGVEAYGQWTSCMAISWRYEAFGTITAPEGEVSAQLESVRAALVEAGYEDVTQVEGHVTVERDDVTVDVEQPGAARGAGKWQFSVASQCADYDGDELERVKNDEARPLDGLAP